MSSPFLQPDAHACVSSSIQLTRLMGADQARCLHAPRDPTALKAAWSCLPHVHGGVECRHGKQWCHAAGARLGQAWKLGRP